MTSSGSLALLHRFRRASRRRLRPRTQDCLSSSMSPIHPQISHTARHEGRMNSPILGSRRSSSLGGWGSEWQEDPWARPGGQSGSCVKAAGWQHSIDLSPSDSPRTLSRGDGWSTGRSSVLLLLRLALRRIAGRSGLRLSIRLRRGSAVLLARGRWLA